MDGYILTSYPVEFVAQANNKVHVSVCVESCEEEGDSAFVALLRLRVDCCHSPIVLIITTLSPNMSKRDVNGVNVLSLPRLILLILLQPYWKVLLSA